MMSRNMHTKINEHRAARMRVVASLVALTMLLVSLPWKVSAVSAWNPTLLVNTESFQVVDEGDGTTSIEIRFGGTLNEKLFYDRSNSRFAFTRSLKVGGNLTVTGSTIINVGNSTTTPDTGVALEVIGTISGSIVRARNAITSSGSLRINGAFTGSTAMFGSGLQNCTGSNKLLWDQSTGRFSCAAETGGTAYKAGQGLTLNGDNAFNVNATLTGSLIRFTTLSGSSVFAKNSLSTSGSLKVLGTMSGASVYGATSLRSSGTLTTDGLIRTKNNLTINSDADTNDAVLTFGNASGNATMTFANATQRFDFNKEIHTSSNLTASGTITVDGAAKFKSTINLNSITYTFPATQSNSGGVLRTNGNGTLSWGPDKSAGSGDVITLHPEYPGATYYQSGSTAVGTMTYSYDETNKENFYRWTTTNASRQDYWTSVRVQVPKNFVHFETASGVLLRLRTTSTSTTNNHITFRLIDTAGSTVAVGNNAQLVSSSASTWRTNTISNVTAGTYTPGGYITLLLKTVALTGNNTDLGWISLNWVTAGP
jgi:hypothetical protein